MFFLFSFPIEEAKANAPCVIFIDELDSVGGKRIESPMHPYSRQTINQLLAEMDGYVCHEKYTSEVHSELVLWCIEITDIDSSGFMQI